MVPKNYTTQRKYQAKIKQALENIYICPSQICNLACHFCYTQKTTNTLSNQQILSFVSKYKKYLSTQNLQLKSILFCGGEVFLLSDFTDLVNRLINQNIFITIITNGTINKLDQIKNPSNCQLLVSLDGPQHIHDRNRGKGNFDKSTKFIKHALSLGFPTEIFFLITKDSYPYIDSFSILNLSKTHLTDRLGSLTAKQIINIKNHYPTYPSKNFGCFQLSLQSNSLIYGCCESSIPLSKITDQPQIIVKNFTNSLKECQNCSLYRNEQFLSPQRMRTSIENRGNPKVARTTKIGSQDKPVCFGCTDPNFLCGYTKELGCQTCQQTVRKFIS